MSQIQHPSYDDSAEIEPTAEALLAGYRAIADLFVYPEDVDREALIEECQTEVLPVLRRSVDGPAADRLETFLEAYETLSVDEYVHTHELDPECPLYVGHYEFDEPETCRDVADADRNQYMVELNAIYEHFGFELADELPDFVPAMVEFLWLTVPERDDDLRDEFIDKFAGLLPGMQEQFEERETPYRHLLAVLRRLLEADFGLSNDREGATNASDRGDDPDPESASEPDDPESAASPTAGDGPVAGGERR